jgi:hypothetical protein
MGTPKACSDRNFCQWAQQDSNLQPRDYESRALPLSYRPQIIDNQAFRSFVLTVSPVILSIFYGLTVPFSTLSVPPSVPASPGQDVLSVSRYPGVNFPFLGKPRIPSPTGTPPLTLRMLASQAAFGQPGCAGRSAPARIGGGRWDWSMDEVSGAEDAFPGLASVLSDRRAQDLPMRVAAVSGLHASHYLMGHLHRGKYDNGRRWSAADEPRSRSPHPACWRESGSRSHCLFAPACRPKKPKPGVNAQRRAVRPMITGG